VVYTEIEGYRIEIDEEKFKNICLQIAPKCAALPAVRFSALPQFFSKKDEKNILVKFMILSTGYNNPLGQYKTEENVILLYPATLFRCYPDEQDKTVFAKRITKTIAHEISHAFSFNGALKYFRSKLHNLMQHFIEKKIFNLWIPTILIANGILNLLIESWLVPTFFDKVLSLLSATFLICAYPLLLMFFLLFWQITREFMADSLAKTLIEKYKNDFNEMVKIYKT